VSGQRAAFRECVGDVRQIKSFIARLVFHAAAGHDHYRMGRERGRNCHLTCGCKNKESCDKMKKGDWCKEGTISCNDKGTECGCTAARVVAPPTKVQPKVQPGGAETPKITPKVVPKATIGGAEQPEAESDTIPTMRPKGGIRQQP
jgi:hypothetical protein